MIVLLPGANSLYVATTALRAGRRAGFHATLGVFVGGGFLRSQKRGRPDTWLYRQLQWRLTLRYPVLAAHLGGCRLIIRTGWWSTRRTAHRGAA